MLRVVLKSALLPPSSSFACALLGLLTWRRFPRAARGLVGLALGSLWLLSTPVVAAWLIAPLQTCPPLPHRGDLGDAHAQAIVVLSADHGVPGAEYGGPTIGAMTLERVRYAASLHRRTGLPILVAGGTAPGSGSAAATAMKRVLEQEFGADVRFVEDRSLDTWENAAFSASILNRVGIRRVFLVTHAWHIPRARSAFERFGLDVVAAPTGFERPPEYGIRHFIPSAGALERSRFALHEYLGGAAYRFRSP